MYVIRLNARRAWLVGPLVDKPLCTSIRSLASVYKLEDAQAVIDSIGDQYRIASTSTVISSVLDP